MADQDTAAEHRYGVCVEYLYSAMNSPRCDGFAAELINLCCYIQLTGSDHIDDTDLHFHEHVCRVIKYIYSIIGVVFLSGNICLRQITHESV